VNAAIDDVWLHSSVISILFTNEGIVGYFDNVRPLAIRVIA
jgi:hypothetical protein